MTTPSTLLQWADHWAKTTPAKTALWCKQDGQWRSTSWREYGETVRAFGAGLVALGHNPKDPVSIVGSNRSEWVLAQMGIVAAGGIPAPIYPTSTKEQTSYIIQHSGVRICVCLLYTSPSPRDRTRSRMPSSA